MTTFRSSAVLLVLALTACARNMPPSNSELGRIARISVYAERRSALRRFAEERLDDRPRLRRELLAAGFEADPVNEDCEYFRWHGRDWGAVFEEGMTVGLCGDRIITNSGANAP